jgi:hypothetical protein
MPWQHYQQVRLAQESYVLARDMPDFKFVEPTGRTHVSGWWYSQKNNPYLIRIDLPAGYPDECPSTYIEWPTPLLDHWNRQMIRHGDSHEYHTWKTKRPGLVNICTFRPAYWNSSNTTVQLIHKSFLWIIAYEEHRASGKKISDLLLSM